MRLNFPFKNIFARLVLFMLTVLISSPLYALETIVVGQVLNSIDRNPIPEVNIFYKNTNTGVKSNEDGYFMIRTLDDKATTLVFSCVGFRRKELKIKPGQSVGIQVQMNEENTILQDVFVVPGANPALELMKKVRNLKAANDYTQYPNFSLKRTEQGLVLLGKVSQRSVNRHIYSQLTECSMAGKDTSLIIPLYMTESIYEIKGKNKRLIAENKFSSTIKSEVLIKQLLGEIQTNVNFYENSILLLGKNMISPLSGSGNIYYNFYLADSLYKESSKIYQVNFRTKNPKNLTFNGKMQIDSATCALVSMKAELSEQANLNYIHKLYVSQNFEKENNSFWTLKDEVIAMNLTYEILADSLHPKPEIFLRNSAVCSTTDTITKREENFAGSGYEKIELDDRLSILNDTRILRIAKWIADVAITGYIPAGKLEIGKIQQIMRVTDIEGLRLTLPLRTNEKLMKNLCLGGYAGYGFRNRKLNYSGYAQLKINEKYNSIIDIGYTNDFRRIDYNYNNFLLYENPLVTGDVDIVNTIFGFRSALKMSERKDFSVSFTTDWTKDIESKLYFRSNQIFSGADLPMVHNGNDMHSISYQTVTASTRFSFDEKTYENHFQRIYISNFKPVLYARIEAGRFQTGQENGNFAKLTGTLKQNVKLPIGNWTYLLQGGWLLGKVPYPLLEIPTGDKTFGYSFNKFSLMYNMEYAMDKYVLMHNELMLNGLILNQIPVIKLLNLREMFSLKMLYGVLNNDHSSMLDYPDYLKPLNKPYVEAGIGVSNIFRILTLQSVWRLANINEPGTSQWRLLASLRIGF